MPHFRTLDQAQFENRENDIRGAALYGVDNEKLGKIEDVIFDHSTGEIHYAVVNTGGWLNHRKFLVPAERIHNYERDPQAFQVDMVKKHVERFPHFDKSVLNSEDDWRDYEKRYREWVTTGDIIHRQGSANIVTPTADEMPVEPSIHQGTGPTGQGRPLELTPRRIATGEISAPTASLRPEEATNTSNATMPSSSQANRHIGSVHEQEDRALERWMQFREGVRKHAQTTSGGCSICERTRRVA